jgi:hypothetical protein
MLPEDFGFGDFSRWIYLWFFFLAIPLQVVSRTGNIIWRRLILAVLRS